jgi:L-proline amide hydrolase
VDDALERHERDATYKDPEYEEAVLVFYKKHFCRVVPFPDCVTDTLNWLERDDTTYFTM